MAAMKASGLVLSRPVTFVTGNAKKLEEVRAILGQSIPFQSLKLDCITLARAHIIFFEEIIIYSILNICVSVPDLGFL